MAIDEMEKKLRPPEIALKPYPPKVITLASGEKMVVREAKREEVGALLGTVHPLIGVPTDFYDIVAVRMYSEILGWYRYRVANEFVLVGTIDGVIAGIVTSRHVSDKLGMSLHTLTIKRGLRVGAQLFAAKMEHHIDILGEDEVWIVAESPIGHRRWMIEYPLEKRFEVQHELGGAPAWALTKETYYKAKSRLVVGSRPVSPELLASSRPIREPDLKTMLVQIGDTLEAKL